MNQKQKNTILEYLITITIAIITFTTPLIIKLINKSTTIPGTYPYYYAKQTQKIISLNTQWIIFITLGIITTILFQTLIKQYTNKKQITIFSTIIFILSPTTLYLTTFSSIYLIPLTSILTFLNLNEQGYKKTALITLIPTLFIDWLTFYTTLSTIFFYLVYKKEKHPLNPAQFLPLYTILYLITNQIMKQPIILEKIPDQNILPTLLSEFGKQHGITIFTFSLATITLIYLWKKRSKNIPLYALMTVLTILYTQLSPQTLIFATPLISILAGYALHKIIQRKWAIKTIQILTIIIISYGIISTGITYTVQKTSSPPTEETIKSLEKIKDENQIQGKTLSHPEKGFWIKYTELDPFITYKTKNYSQKKNITQKIFQSRDLKETLELTRKNNISTIIIDKKMKKEQVWDSKNQGLLFLLRNPRFIRIYKTPNIEAWKIKPE